jgi:putative glutamine amidotransferase
MRNKAVILIPSAIDEEKNLLYVKKQYCDALINAGALPFIMPVTDDVSVIDTYINMCGGILIMGGVDVDPRLYGDVNRTYNGRISPQRDFVETYVIKKAAQSGMPLLGICRGIQILNTAMGGTLYQDIYAQKGTDMRHSQNAPEWYDTHSVTVAKDSWIYRATGLEQINVNSFHHQAVKDIAPGFEAVCYADDGVIEAIESLDKKMLGVQWHPELMYEKAKEHEAIFIEFVKLIF